MSEDQPAEETVNASVQVSPDGLELYLVVQDPWRYSRDGIVELLRDSGYHGPLDELGIDALSRGENFGVATRVICGNAPVAGSDEEFYYHFESLKPRAKQEAETSEQEPFAIDHRESRKIDRCDVGDVLVRIVREKDPTRGVDAWGRESDPPRGKELKLQPGQNVTLGPDGRSLIAAIAGVPTREPNGRISVARALVVQGVNFKSGNIHFDGSVSVDGDVAAGFIVEATADVEIKGSIEHATIRAGGSILVKGGVRRQSQLFAAGSIEVRFVDSESRLEARSTVTVTQDAIQSELAGDEGVFIGGQLVGGSARSAMHIQVTSLGCPRDTPTRAIIDRPLTPAKVIGLKEELGLIVPQDRSGPSAEEIAAQGNSLLRLGNTARVVAARPATATRALSAAGVPSVPRPPSTAPRANSNFPQPAAQAPATSTLPARGVNPALRAPGAPAIPGPSGASVPPVADAAIPRAPDSSPPSSRLGSGAPPAKPSQTPGPPPAPALHAPLNPAARPGGASVAPPARPAPPGSTVAPNRNPALAGAPRPGMPTIRMPGAAPTVGVRTTATTMPAAAGRLAPPKPLGLPGAPGGRIGVVTGVVGLPKTLSPSGGSGKPLVTSRIEELSKLATVALYDQIAILPPNATGRIVATTTVRPGVTLVMSQITRAVDVPLGPRAFRMEEAQILEAVLGPNT